MKVRKVRKYKIIGIMSGTSLDGVDIAYCRFVLKKKTWTFSVRAAQTFPYDPAWKSRLAKAPRLSGEALAALHTLYGTFLGQCCRQFAKQRKINKIDGIASHGHTIFHQPKNKFTYQLGDGNALHAAVRLPVVCDFRGLDIALGGEGAPLVPPGDKFLFSNYDICLNLGGIANLSMDVRGERKAFDICFCNMMLNHLAAKAQKDFDRNGEMARPGLVNPGLLNSMEKKYRARGKKYPSLGREGFEQDFLPLLEDESIPLRDRLRTVCESVADEIVRSIPLSAKRRKLLATGGGAHNGFLMELIERKLSRNTKITVPQKIIVDFKEALVFAFLGVLRLRGEINVLKSVTGASRDSCSGILIG
jgi:anhydro-N-acetylmuramic acid kinase